MAFFALSSDITIGNFRFTGVHDIHVKRSLHTYADSAVITLPSKCMLVKGNKATPEMLTTADQFNEGDKVIINLGYNAPAALKKGSTPIIKGASSKNSGSSMCTVFCGFVKKKGLNMPLQVECEGYVRRLRQDVNINTSHKKTKVSELLKLLEKNTKGESTGIKTVVADDLDLVNVTIPGKNGVELVEAIKRMSHGVLNIFFIEPATLWCGLTYTPYSRGEDPFCLGEVDYRLGYNIVKDNSLRERTEKSERVKIIFNHIPGDGEIKKGESGSSGTGNTQNIVARNVSDAKTLELMAKEKQFMESYTGYEGSINGFLQPWCEPGWIANISDKRYPKRDGKYLVEATEITFGKNGARIKVDIGPMLGFKNAKI